MLQETIDNITTSLYIVNNRHKFTYMDYQGALNVVKQAAERYRDAMLAAVQAQKKEDDVNETDQCGDASERVESDDGQISTVVG